MPASEGPALNSSTHAPQTLLAMGSAIHRTLLAKSTLQRLPRTATVDTSVLVTDYAAADPALLDAAEVLFTHWGSPVLTEESLRRMPRLRAVVHAAGSVKHHVTEAVWERGITVSSAAAANALSVAEFTLAAILFANKRVLDSAHLYRETRGRVDLLPYLDGHGNYRRTVGIVGASRTGRRVVELLRPFDFEVLVYDPYLTGSEADELGVGLVTLDELVRCSHVVSIHAPQLPETRHMFDARRLALLRDGATLINTARGSLVDTGALSAQLATGRIHAVIDVTDPEIMPAGSPLYDLPNVLLTPHVAGSLGNELDRMAHCAIDEVGRYAKGLPFLYGVGPDELARSA
ncbi:hydroxyacid dehydrogenase [Streptomyces sp. NPDC094466]|uniref:hydroxyacid dehydrogenase n=1 Tax=Streptomyces sp. NPDC094466 TaxID=3366065 RepID=UPI0037FA2200